MHNYSNELALKFSNPKISSKPTDWSEYWYALSWEIGAIP